MNDFPPRYDGTLQPEVWVQDLRFFCALRVVSQHSQEIRQKRQIGNGACYFGLKFAEFQRIELSRDRRHGQNEYGSRAKDTPIG